MINFSCYEHIIGLSRTDCGCSADGRPADFDLSESGLYLTDLKPLNKVKGLEGCETGNVWQILANARDEAVRSFISDSNALIYKNYELKHPPFDGVIGYPKASKVVDIGAVAGIRLACKPVKPVMIQVKRIGTLFEAEGTVTLQVFDNYGNQPVADILLSTTAGKINWNEVSFELPLDSKYGQQEYYLVYENNGNRPLDNQVSCMCDGFRPRFSLGSPYYKGRYSGHYGWANYLMCGGVDTTGTGALDALPATAGNRMNGLVLEAEVACNINSVICNGQMDFDSDPLAMSVAEAIRLKAGMLLLQKLAGSNRLNRETLIAKGSYGETVKTWGKDYNEAVMFISESVDIEKCPCLQDKDKYGMRVGGIFV